MTPPEEPFTPLRQALLHLVPTDRRQETLRLLHAVIQTVMTNCALEPNKSNEDLAADSRCYGRALREMETILGEKPNPFAMPTSASARSIPLSPAEFDRIKNERAKKNQPTK